MVAIHNILQLMYFVFNLKKRPLWKRII